MRRSGSRALALALLAVASACGSAAGDASAGDASGGDSASNAAEATGGSESQAAGDSTSADGRVAPITSTVSVVLERGTCKGGCTPYRLQLSDDGTVSMLLAGEATVHTDQIPAEQVRALLASMTSGGFQSLDTAIVEGAASCGGYAMDAPVVTLRMQSSDDVHSVRHDYGCASLPRLLRAWGATADSIANSARWLPSPTGASR